MIIYLHGFNSSGESQKGQYLKQQLGLPVLTPSYPWQPEQAMAFLTQLVETSLTESEQLMLAGSSLGGYYACYLGRQYRLPTMMINPALGPVDTLRPYLGWNNNYYSGEKYYLEERHLDELRRYQITHPCENHTATLLLLDAGDEIINYRYAYDLYRDCAEVKLFPGGDHQFQHLAEALPLIRNFYLKHSGY